MLDGEGPFQEARTMTEMLLLLKEQAPHTAIKKIESEGGRVLQQYGSNVLIVQADPHLESVLQDSPAVTGVYKGDVPVHAAEHLDMMGSMGVAAWNKRHTPAFVNAKASRPGAGLSWGHPDFEREG
jgi:hypothetical protein